MTCKFKVLCAFAIVYLVWGSTYLAIKFAVATLPPFLMMAFRFALAGTLLYAFTAIKGAPRPTRSQFWSGTWIGFLMVVMGTGVIGWVEERLPSGLTALVLAATPVWMVLFEAARENGVRPGRDGVIGLLLGLGGMLMLISPSELGQGLDLFGLLVLILVTVSWAFGSIMGRHADLPKNTLQSTAVQMITGSVGLTVLGLINGDFQHLAEAEFSLKSSLALAYLIVFGSLLVFPAYNWLVKNVNPTLVATHAYINPIVALALGYCFADEPITTRTVLAATIILASVLFISNDRPKQRRPKPVNLPASEVNAAT